MLPALLLPLLMGCPPDDTGAQHTDSPAQPVALVDANGGSFSATLQAETALLAEGLNATLDWGGLTQDLLGRPLQPTTDITEARIFSFRSLDQATILEGLATETLSQSDVSFIVSCTPESDRCDLEEFVTMGHWLIPSRDFLEGLGVWLLELRGDTDQGIRALAFLQPSATTQQHLYVMGDSASSLAVTLDLTALTPVQLDAGPTVALDWAGLTHTAQGVEFESDRLDRAVLYRFDQDTAQAATDLLAWPSLAAETWSLEVEGTELELGSMLGDSAFTGIDSDSVWMLALYCTRCDLAVPRFVTVLTPRS